MSDWPRLVREQPSRREMSDWLRDVSVRLSLSKGMAEDARSLEIASRMLVEEEEQDSPELFDEKCWCGEHLVCPSCDGYEESHEDTFCAKCGLEVVCAKCAKEPKDSFHL